MDLSKYTKPQIDRWIRLLNLTNEEEKIFFLLTKGKCRQEIADKMKISIRTLDRRIAKIHHKINEIGDEI